MRESHCFSSPRKAERCERTGFTQASRSGDLPDRAIGKMIGEFSPAENVSDPRGSSPGLKRRHIAWSFPAYLDANTKEHRFRSFDVPPCKQTGNVSLMGQKRLSPISRIGLASEHRVGRGTPGAGTSKSRAFLGGPNSAFASGAIEESLAV